MRPLPRCSWVAECAEQLRHSMGYNKSGLTAAVITQAKRFLDGGHGRKTSSAHEAKEAEEVSHLGTPGESGSDAEVLSLVRRNVEAQRERQTALRRDLAQIVRTYSKLKPEVRSSILNQLRKVVSWNDLPAHLVVKSGGHVVRPSFRASLAQRSLLRRCQRDYVPERLLDDKVGALAFVERLQVRRPEVMAVDVTADELPRRAGVVVKPTQGTGSRGVFLIPREDDIFQVSRSREKDSIQSWEELVRTMKAHVAAGKVEDRWMMEELILPTPGELNSGRDFKFYCFYGRVELVLEVRRYPKVRYAWWNRDGSSCETGKYSKERMKGTGLQEGDIDLIERIGQSIPAPFLRIDFLRSETGLVYGEFTSRPGTYDDFDDATDERLGRAFCVAEGRLVADLLDGKRFDDFLLTTNNAMPVSG